jgi:hypothetical protein
MIAGKLLRAVSQKLTDVSEVHTASTDTGIAAMMETVSSSETPFNFYDSTRRNIPEDKVKHPSLRT